MSTAVSTDLGSDIFGLASERRSYEYQVIHPGTRKGMGFFIMLQSIRSEAPSAIAKEIERTVLKRNRQNKPLTPEEIRTNTIRVTAACVLGWRWDKDENGKAGNAGGKQLEFTPANLLRVLEVDEIREQLGTELNDEANFYQGSVSA